MAATYVESPGDADDRQACHSEFPSPRSILLTFTDLIDLGNAAFRRLPRFRSIERDHDDRDDKQRGDQRKSAIDDFDWGLVASGGTAQFPWLNYFRGLPFFRKINA